MEEALKTLEIVGAKCNVKFKKKKSFACHHCRVLRQSFSVASVALLLAIDAELMVAS